MEEQWQNALAGFDGVWQRVQGGEVPPLPETPDKAKAALEALLTTAAQAAACYRSVGLPRLAGDCLMDRQRLGAAYFLLYGEDFAPAPEPLSRGVLPQRLRAAYLREKAEGAACDAAAVAADDGALRQLCAALAKRSARRREAVFGLLCRVFR